MPNSRLSARKSLREYLGQYKSEHTKMGTKLTHMVGIPMIVASIPTAFVAPVAAGALFTGGWALQFAGHYFFEKQKPSFFSDPYYLGIGVVWVAVEWAELFGLPIPEELTPAAPSDSAEPVVERHAAPASAPN